MLIYYLICITMVLSHDFLSFFFFFCKKVRKYHLIVFNEGFAT